MVYTNKVSCLEEEEKVIKNSKLKEDIKSAVIFLVIMFAIGVVYLIKQKILHSKIFCFMGVVKNLQTSLKVSNPQN